MPEDADNMGSDQLSDCPTLHTQSIHPTSARVVQPRHHQEPAPARLYLLLLETESGEVTQEWAGVVRGLTYNYSTPNAV